MTPPCYNRPPMVAGRWEDTGRMRFNLLPGLNQRGTKPVLRWRPNPFVDRCATHDGRGIGPNGESYPDAHGWDCAGCRWEPAHIRQKREFDARMQDMQWPSALLQSIERDLAQPSPLRPVDLIISGPSPLQPLFERLLRRAQEPNWLVGRALLEAPWFAAADRVIEKRVDLTKPVDNPEDKPALIHSRPTPGSIHPDDE